MKKALLQFKQQQSQGFSGYQRTVRFCRASKLLLMGDNTELQVCVFYGDFISFVNFMLNGLNKKAGGRMGVDPVRASLLLERSRSAILGYGTSSFAATEYAVSTANEATSSQNESSAPTLTPSVGFGTFGYSGDLNPRLNFTNRTAPQFALSLGVPFSQRFSLGLGVGFLQTGAETVSKASGSKTIFRDSYFSVPLTAQFDFVQFSLSKSAVYVKTGFTTAFLTSSKVTFSDGVTEDAPNSAKLLFLGSAGLGTKLSLSSRTVFNLEAYYVQSLSNVIKSDLATIHANGFILATGIGFDL